MEAAGVFKKRRAGVLLHITSLPSGTLGDDAFKFIDFLHHAKVSIWQMLPINPTHSDGSPYQCLSAHAINPSLLSHEKLKTEAWFDEHQNQTNLIGSAHQQFFDKANESTKHQYADFLKEQAYWLDDYVLFCELRELNQNKAWFDWNEPFRNRDAAALEEIKQLHSQSLSLRCFEQFLLFVQWQNVKKYANEKQVLLFGDIPIFVAHDSAEVWAAPEMFQLDEFGHPIVVAGVPPDYFSETGQRWGNPLYDWQHHAEQNFEWWKLRLQTQLQLFDLIRIDHFRGFEACWEIPASCETAIEGTWVEAPGDALFSALMERFGELPLVAEDLGIITEQVTALREKYVMPGMKILHFAFGGGSENPYLPHQHTHDSVIYTGTHDNDTSIGWYESADEHVKHHFHEYIGNNDSSSIAWTLIQTALSSVASTAIVPFQDVLQLNGEHRMNVPGTVEGNWTWRFDWPMVQVDAADKLRKLNELYGRS
jgi:4-alpha-glucanotransferase